MSSPAETADAVCGSQTAHSGMDIRARQGAEKRRADIRVRQATDSRRADRRVRQAMDSRRADIMDSPAMVRRMVRRDIIRIRRDRQRRKRKKRSTERCFLS